MAKTIGAGDLSERLTFQSAGNVAIPVTSLTRVSTTATAVTDRAHGFTAGDFVTIAESLTAGWNADVQVATVPSTTSFTFTVAGSPTTPAAGLITATFVSDAQGGTEDTWRDQFTVWGKVEPLSATEVLQAQAIGSQVRYRATVRYRADIEPAMRISWVRYLATAARTLQILGVLPDADRPRELLTVECGDVQ